MSHLFVLDPTTLEKIAVIDEYVSCIWRQAYYDVGDFELYVSASAKAIGALQANRYLVRSEDASVNDGVVTYKKVMIIKNLDLTTDAEDGDYFKVTGRELKYILHKRVVWSQTSIDDTAENGIRQLVTDNAISPADDKRILPLLELGESSGLTDRLHKQITGKVLDEEIAEICTRFGYGWDVYIEDSALKLVVYQSVDRSFNQTDRAFVVFADSYNNLYNTEYQLMTESYATTALVLGEGEGVDRKRTVINDDLSGDNRYEVYVDARDLSRNEGTEDEIPLEDYMEQLEARGRDKLAELAITEGLSGEVMDNVSFKYGVDYFLGDIVTVINSYGISKDVRVVSVIESEDETGAKLTPQFNN